MCGRFVSASLPGEIADYFSAASVAKTRTEANYNVAPSVNVPVIVSSDDLRQLDLMRWGLIPFWAKSASIGNKMINARSETVTEKAAFRNAAKKYRCIVPADAFYEWTAVNDPTAKKPRKQPWCIRRNDGAPFAFAGIFDSWSDPDGDGTRLRSCTILTGPANAAVEPIHDRMPIMVAPAMWDAWLNPGDHDAQTLLDSLQAPPSELFAIHAVSTAVNNSRSSGVQLMDEVEPMTAESLAAEAEQRAAAADSGRLL
jgi:putative SOS response-associated peptidase YedK